MSHQTSFILLDDAVAEIQVSYNSIIENSNRIKVVHAHEAQQLFRQVWDAGKLELQESFKVMLLNRNNQILGIVTVAEGGIASTQVDTRLLIGIILKSASVAVILAHNHPSGNCNPSELDLKLQKNIEEKCRFFNIDVLDHIILTKDCYYSFSQSATYGN